nr:polycomb group RING finger protein 1 [Pogona vitticeps]
MASPPPQGGPMAIATRLRNQLQAVYKMDPLRNEGLSWWPSPPPGVCVCLCLPACLRSAHVGIPVPWKRRRQGPGRGGGRLRHARRAVCKSCIVKYLQTSKYCPMCSTKIHETQPLLNLKLDRVMQDIVFKLVPGLQESEERRIREFCQSRAGMERGNQPSSEGPASDRVGLPCAAFDHSRAHYYRFDEHVLLCLEKQSSGKEKNKHILQHKYVRCSARAQIRHLRRVLCCRLELALPHVHILFNNELLPDSMTLKQLWLSRWFGKPAPLLLHYSVKEKRR